MKYFLDIKNIVDERHAGSKAVQDVRTILLKKGYRPIIVSPKKTMALICFIKLFLVILFVFKKRDTLFVQYPPHYYRYYANFISILRKIKKIKTILLIHDVTYIRYQSSNFKVKEINFFNRFDYVIGHNEQMNNILRQDGVKSNLVELKLFDYLVNKNAKINIKLATEKQVIIAGNLDYNKSKYIYEFLNVSNFPVSLFGINYDKNKTYNNPNCKYYGSFKPDELPMILNNGFGLVWDGPSIDDCLGDFGKYLKYNNPHKLSLYLASGIPVIVWKKAAVSKFVLENKLGFVIDNLHQVNDILNKITDNEYLNLKNNVFTFQKKVLKGSFLEDVLNDLEKEEN